MRPVERWTGAEAHALRQALRLSVRAFAGHLGVASRTVAKWDAARSNVTLRMDTQAILDSALSLAPEEAQSRFAAIVASQEPATGQGVEEDSDVRRREFLGGALAILGSYPSNHILGQVPHASGHRVGQTDIEAVREMTSIFSQMDQRRGGGHATTAVRQYLASDVSGYLFGKFKSEQSRREMHAAAGELSYLAGWMAFDNANYADSDHLFDVAMALAAEGEDPSLEGHILRAMAHKALDLGQFRRGLDLAESSVAGQRFALASSRERALTGVVRARALASNDQGRDAAAALLAAEKHLDRAENNTEEEPGRVFFFGEASLAHETANALQRMGDVQGAIRQFRRSVEKRKASAFKRTHAVTLGYLGSALALNGSVEEACGVWTTALDEMDGVNSGRARRVVADIRGHLSKLRDNTRPEVIELKRRTTAYLAEGV
jgi:tetratricopeptide (TPR) repeat protein